MFSKIQKDPLKKPQNHLVVLLAILGLISGFLSIGALLIFPKDNSWLFLFFLTVFIFLLVKVVKYLSN